MSKFNVSVEIDYIDEDGNLDDEICEQIVNSVVNKVSDAVMKRTEERAQSLFEERLQTMENTVSARLNAMMDEFFSTPKDITTAWGEVKRHNVTVKQLLEEACDNFMNQSLDRNGNPVKGSSYGVEYKTRVDYIVSKSIDHNMECAIKKAVSDVTENLKKRISDEIKQQMGEKLAGIVGLENLIRG